MLALDATMAATTAKYGSAVGIPTAVIEAPVINAEPPSAVGIGRARRARRRREIHNPAAQRSRATPATSSITCLTVPLGRGTSPISHPPGPVISTTPTTKCTTNTPIVNSRTRRTRAGTVAK